MSEIKNEGESLEQTSVYHHHIRACHVMYTIYLGVQSVTGNSSTLPDNIKETCFNLIYVLPIIRSCVCTVTVSRWYKVLTRTECLIFEYIKRVSLSVRTCELFLCFVAVRVRAIVLTSLFSLFYVTGEFHRFLHQGRAHQTVL